MRFRHPDCGMGESFNPNGMRRATDQRMMRDATIEIHYLAARKIRGRFLARDVVICWPNGSLTPQRARDVVQSMARIDFCVICRLGPLVPRGLVPSQEDGLSEARQRGILSGT